MPADCRLPQLGCRRGRHLLMTQNATRALPLRVTVRHAQDLAEDRLRVDAHQPSADVVALSCRPVLGVGERHDAGDAGVGTAGCFGVGCGLGRCWAGPGAACPSVTCEARSTRRLALGLVLVGRPLSRLTDGAARSGPEAEQSLSPVRSTSSPLYFSVTVTSVVWPSVTSKSVEAVRPPRSTLRL